MTGQKSNPSIKERLATIEALVKDIKDNHLKDITDRIKTLSNRFWWLILTLLLFLLGVLLKR